MRCSWLRRGLISACGSSLTSRGYKTMPNTLKCARAVLRFVFLVVVELVAVSTPISAYAIDILGALGVGADSGTGKIAKLAFTLKEDFVPTSIVWSPDGRFIASSGTHTRSIHIWDVSQEKLV